MVNIFPSREIVLQVGSLTIRWYGLLWVASFWLVWHLAPKLQKYRGLTLSHDEWTEIIAWGAIGALIGGRIGYVLFYEPAFFFQHPLQIVAIWHGGMSSHGGFIGVGLAVWLLLRKQRNVLAVLDVLTVPIALTLALGRLGNFINLEIFGSNPIAIGKELLVAGVCYWVLQRSGLYEPHARFPKKTPVDPPSGGTPDGSHLAAVKAARPLGSAYDRPCRLGSDTLFAKGACGSTLAVFLITYSVLRLLIEPLRDDPWVLMFGLTRGQLLTLPLLVLGVWLLVWRLKLQQLLKKPTSG